MKNLPGKTAIVTGGASGIGLAIARALLNAGMNVAIADIQQSALDQATAALNHGDRLMALLLDVTDRAAFAAFADAVEQRFGNIHLLCNNAGVVVSGPVAQASFSDWDWVINVNLMGVVNGIVTLLPRILAHGEGGHIVNTASTSGLLPHAGATVYVASKSAVIGMTEAMRCELEPKGVIASVLCPGPVQSQIGAADRNRQAAYGGGTAPPPTEARLSDSASDVFQMMMPAEAVGELVLRGIENDQLYILTHGEHREGLALRAAAIDAALPRTAENVPLKQAMAGILKNPAHVAEIGRYGH